jgi:hypothetical protein
MSWGYGTTWTRLDTPNLARNAQVTGSNPVGGSARPTRVIDADLGFFMSRGPFDRGQDPRSAAPWTGSWTDADLVGYGMKALAHLTGFAAQRSRLALSVAMRTGSLLEGSRSAVRDYVGKSDALRRSAPSDL